MARLAAVAAPSSLSLGLVLFAGGFAAQVASAFVSEQGGGAPIVWLPGGVLLTALMSVPQTRWPSCIAGIVAGVAAAAALPEGPMLERSWPPLLVLLLVPVGANVMRIVFADATPSRPFRNIGWFLAMFALALPAVAGVAGAYAGLADSNQYPEGLPFALAHALGYLVFAPIWFRPRAHWSTLQRMFAPAPWPAVTSLAAIAGIGFLWSVFGSYSHLRPLLVLAPIPVLVFTGLRARLAGTYFAVVLVAIVAIQVSRMGRGPFVESTPSSTTLSLTSWIFAMAVASWLLAVLIEQRVDMRRALVHRSREVRELAGRLIEAQEQERSRIARDLHDDVNQRLASVSIELSSIRRGADARSRDELTHVQDELIALSEDVRQISHNLHPSMLHEIGLEAGLGSLCHTQRHRNGPSIDLHVAAGVGDLPDAVALCLYRVAQEALANVIRHAMARRIEVRLAIVEGQAELKVEDDGRGFETARPRGLGLLSLEERAKLLGGSFQLSTSPGKGTRICIRIPLQPHRPR